MTPGQGGTTRELRSRALVWLVGVAVAIVVLWALHRTVWVSMPVFAAFFIAIAVWPVTDWMQCRLPAWLGWLGHVAAMLIISVCLMLFVAGIWYAAQEVASGWLQYEDGFQKWWSEATQFLNAYWNGAATGGGADNQARIGEEVRPLQFISGFAMTIVRSIWNIVAVLVLIFFLVLLMLLEARTWHAKLGNLTDGRNMSIYGNVVGDMAKAFRAYLFVRAVVGLMTAAAYGLWLWIWEIDFLIVWMLVAFLLNFVPTIGSLVAGGLAFGFALLQKDPATALAIGAGLIVIEQIFGNYVDPVMQGRNLSLSPLAVLFMLLLWGWVWGVPGMLLAAPMTVLIVMISARIPALLPVALALSGERSLDALFRRIHSP